MLLVHLLPGPYIELLANDRRLKAILIGVTAAVVGVIANLAVYFATQVLFPEGVSLGGLDVFALVVAVVSFVVLQRYKVPIYLMVPAGALLGDGVDPAALGAARTGSVTVTQQHIDARTLKDMLDAASGSRSLTSASGGTRGGAIPGSVNFDAYDALSRRRAGHGGLSCLRRVVTFCNHGTSGGAPSSCAARVRGVLLGGRAEAWKASRRTRE